MLATHLLGVQFPALMVLATLAEPQDSLKAVSAEAIQLETDRLQARPQVVLHFDFMSESTTQVLSADYSTDQLFFGKLHCPCIVLLCIAGCHCCNTFGLFRWCCHSHCRDGHQVETGNILCNQKPRAVPVLNCALDCAVPTLCYAVDFFAGYGTVTALYAMQTKSTQKFRRQVSNCNIAAAGLCLLLLFCNLAMFIWRVTKAWLSNKRW